MQRLINQQVYYYDPAKLKTLGHLQKAVGLLIHSIKSIDLTRHPRVARGNTSFAQRKRNIPNGFVFEDINEQLFNIFKWVHRVNRDLDIDG